MRSYTIIPLLLALLFAASCREARIHERKDLEKLFEAQGIRNGCFILKDQVHESVYFYNKERCLQQFIPASTFKVFNSLVALETAVAPDESLIIKWDSIPRWNAEWNRDMSMKDAFRLSNVGYYQEIARRIGYSKMKYYIDSAKYGNMELKSKIDTFWLDNTLKISADEQIGMLKRMYFEELKPFSARSQRIVKEMMLREETPQYRLYYKTGWGKTKDAQVLWVVGFVEKIMHVKEHKESMNKSSERDLPYFFAENFDVPNSDTSAAWVDKRITLLKNALKQFDIIK